MSDAPAIVGRFDNPFAAHTAAARLEGEGIPSWIIDENQVAIDPLLTYALGGIKLVVAARDVEAAREALEHRPAAAAATAEEETCPHCGSSELTRHQAGRRFAFLTILFFGIPVGRARAPRRRNLRYNCGVAYPCATVSFAP